MELWNYVIMKPG